MANYNTKGLYYNKKPPNGGAMYNGATYFVLFRLEDVFSAGDAVTRLLASSIIYETPRISDAILLSIYKMLTDSFVLNVSTSNANALYRVTDRLNISDAISSMIVSLFVADRFKELDSISKLSTLIAKTESFKGNEITSVKSLMKIMDQAGMSDLSALIGIVLRVYDQAFITDSDPKTAVADFVIGNPSQVGETDLDAAFDWMMPFGLMLDWVNSSIPRMPSASSEEIEIDGVDGSMLVNTKYHNRDFRLVGWSQDGLTQQQKDSLVKRITEILQATKKETKTLTFARTGTSFDVKYDGEATFEEGPSFLKAIIPLTGSAYGYNRFEKQVVGSGLISNAGIATIGVISTISGECDNPSFIIGTEKIDWTGHIPSGTKLVIDHAREICYLIDQQGVKTNARASMSGKFVKIPAGGTVIVVAESIEDKIVTTWYDKLLW